MRHVFLNLAGTVFCAIVFMVSIGGRASLFAADGVQVIIYDMTLPGDARQHGVPDAYDWSDGNAYVRPDSVAVGMGAVTAWGQLYEPRDTNPAVNTRVQIRNVATYTLSKADGQWHRVQYMAAPKGGAYTEDFLNNVSKTPDKRTETSGGISVTAGDGYNFHFFPEGRASVNQADLMGVLTTVEARLIVGNPGLPDDRNIARYLLQMGCGWWKTLTIGWSLDNTHDFMCSRTKWVTNDWQFFTATNIPADSLRKYPPQITLNDATGVVTEKTPMKKGIVRVFPESKTVVYDLVGRRVSGSGGKPFCVFIQASRRGCVPVLSTGKNGLTDKKIRKQGTAQY